MPAPRRGYGLGGFLSEAHGARELLPKGRIKKMSKKGGALLVGAFLDRAGERATDLLSHSRADKRLAEIGTKRSTAEHEKHGVEQSTASSRAVSKHACARAAVISASSCGSHLQLDIKIFRLRRCGHAPEARNFLGTRHAEKMVASMTFMTSMSSRIVVSRAHGVNMGGKCAISVTIMQSCDHFTRKLMPAAIHIQPKIRPLQPKIRPLRTFNG